MQLCRFDKDRLGVVEGNNVRDVTAALDVLPPYRYPLPGHDVLVANLDAVRSRIESLRGRAPVVPLSRVTLLSPVANPGKIIAAPVNYQKHLDEVKSDSQIHANNPAHTITIQQAGVFLKANSSLVGPGEGIPIRKPDRRTDHEVELAFVIGRTASHVSRADALRYIAGYAIGLDVSIRGSEDRSLRKSADGYTRARPLDGDRRRDSRPGHARPGDFRQRRAASVVQYQVSDPGRARADRARLVVLHALSGRHRPHGYARKASAPSIPATASSRPSSASARWT